MDLTQLTALELAKKIKQKQISAVEATKSILNKIKANDKNYNAYITICEQAIVKAEQMQKKIVETDSPLAGVPVSIKDNINTKGILTTCASKMLSNYISVYNATVVEKLERAGAIIIGKLNMDEFAMGNTNETSYYGAVKNPWDSERVAGGSSGGAAAAVCTDEAFYTLATDTGGSIRQPAAFCGVTGIKPTYGLVSRYGLIAFASSLDQIGTIAHNVEDCAAALSIIAGSDNKDSTCTKIKSYNFLDALIEDVKGLKIGIPLNYISNGLEKEIKASILQAAKKFEDMGANIEEFSFDFSQYAIPAYYILSSAEASSNLSRYDGIRYGYRAKNIANINDLYVKSRSDGFGQEVKRRILLGTFVLSSGYYDSYYKKALQVRELIKASFEKAFQKFDIILTPVTPTTALKLNQSLDDPLKMYLGDIYTVSVNIVGLPAVSIPCGFDKNNLPIGLQLIGNHFDERTLIQAAYTFQQATDYHKKKPNLKENQCE